MCHADKFRPCGGRRSAEGCAAVCRANKAVQDSRGVVRQDTTGGACKAAFKKLPGVGPGMAKRLYDLGCRCHSSMVY